MVSRWARTIVALLRVSVLESFAYRGEMIVWLLTTTMPLLMLALLDTVVREKPMGRYGQAQITAYYLATFIVRQMTGCWMSWQMNMEVRSGALSSRLLKPLHPLLAYAVETAASVPMRAAISLPVAVILLVVVGRDGVAHDPVIWLCFALALSGAWLISLLVSLTIGSLSFTMESSSKVMDVWLAFYFVASGYLLPVELFPKALRSAIDWLPFRYQIGLPVELMTDAHGRLEALSLLGRQWLFVGLFYALAMLTWRRGVARFEAFGG